MSIMSLQTHTRTHTQRMYKQVGKQRALVTGLGILMKNSNNIKLGVSTADTLMLRALQTDRVTRHTHYAATVQPLSVMMMAALTGAQLLKPLSCKHSEGGERRTCAQTCQFLQIYVPANVTGRLDCLHAPLVTTSSGVALLKDAD